MGNEMMKPNSSSVIPLQHQREYFGEELGKCGEAETKCLELVYYPLQRYSKVRLRIWMDKNLEAGVLEASEQHHVLLPDGPHNSENRLHPHDDF